MTRARRNIKIKRGTKPGSRPGLVVPSKEASNPVVSIMAYGPQSLIETEANLDEISELKDRHAVLWINIVGLGDADLILRLGELFGLHRLALEDVVNTHQRPKVEEFKDHLFIVARMLHTEGSVETEQVSMFLGKGFVLTLQERPGDCFETVRERIRRGKGSRIRDEGSDYLCYALIDSIIDGYFPALEQCGESLESLEDKVVAHPEGTQISKLHDLKRDLLMLRRAIWPQREMINALIRDENDVFTDTTKLYLRDCYDHTFQLIDLVETYREIASGLVDVHLSSVSAKLNEVMKVLTIIATIFMPLSFIASLYGMNFDRNSSPWNMPELGWYMGYPFALLLMVITAAGFLWYFNRKGWLRDGL